MKKPVYETIKWFGKGIKPYRATKNIIGYEQVNRLGFSRKKNSRPKKYGRKLSTGFKK